MKSYSQIGQDLAVVKHYKEKSGGYFCEIGAFDGISLSNTYLLETIYGWRGICAEPIPEQYEKLRQNRKAICTNKAVYSTSGQELIFDSAKEAMLSGIAEHIDCHKHAVDRAKTQIKVQTITLTDLLDMHNAPRFIEYLSLDTEGSELEILKGLDFTKYEFGLIDIEHNYVEPRRTQMREFLTSKSYEYIGENNWDDMYRIQKSH